VEPGTVYAIERGDHPPSFTLFLEFAKLYKVDEADLLTWPGTHMRHDLREVIRFTPNAELEELREVWQQVVGSDLPDAKTRSR
jgi:DNA-binding XRE family transcriptional regulator